MATVYVKLNTGIAFATFAAGATFISDDTYDQVKQLLNADLATLVSNPGGTLPTYAPGNPGLTAGAQASAVAVGTGGASDSAGQLSITALATGMAAGALVTVTFLAPKAAAPKAIVLTDQSAVANGLYVSAKSATGFTISSRAAASASQAIKVEYAVFA